MKSYMYIGHVVSWKDNPKEIIEWVKRNKEDIPKVIISEDLSDWLIHLLPEILDEDCKVKLTDTLDNEEAFVIYQKIDEVREPENKIEIRHNGNINWGELKRKMEEIKPEIFDLKYHDRIKSELEKQEDYMYEEHNEIVNIITDRLKKEVNCSNFVTKKTGGEVNER